MDYSHKIITEYNKYTEFLQNKGAEDKIVSISTFASTWAAYSIERRKDPTVSHKSIRKKIEYDSLFGTKYNVALERRRQLNEFINSPQLSDYLDRESYAKVLKNKDNLLNKSLSYFKKQNKDDFDDFLKESGIYTTDLYRYVLDQNNNNTKKTALWFSQHMFGSR